MRIHGLSRALLRDLLIPILCALIALSGIAQARAHGGKTFAPGLAAQMTLCASANAAEGDGPLPDHDCSDCCLPRLVVLPDHRPALPFHFLQRAAVEPEVAPPVLGRSAARLPWSRGPPATT